MARYVVQNLCALANIAARYAGFAAPRRCSRANFIFIESSMCPFYYAQIVHILFAFGEC